MHKKRPVKEHINSALLTNLCEIVLIATANNDTLMMIGDQMDLTDHEIALIRDFAGEYNHYTCRGTNGTA